MTRSKLIDHVRRTMAHAIAGTVPLAEDVHRVPAADYIDTDRWSREIEQIFRRVPLVLGYSAELRDPGAYRAIEVVDTPVLLVRGQDGALRSFVNTCSHRGSQLVAEGTGTARRFACPYHAWTYDDGGRLVGVLDRDEFGTVDLDCHGLTPLWCEERAGLVFGSIRPEQTLDLDPWLRGYDQMLDHLGLCDATLVGRQEIDGPNWKIAYDGYLDFYHLPILHRETFGPKMSNKAIYDAWGPHQRVTSPDARMGRYADAAEEDWPDAMLLDGVWTVFPHLSIARFDVGGPICMVSQLLPGTEPGSSRTIQTFLAERPDTDEVAMAEQMAFLAHVVRDEDYATGFGIQRGLATGANTHVLFGRNEAGGQRFHTWVDRVIDAETPEQLQELIETATTEFQP